MDRILMLLPSVLTIAGIAGITFVYLNWIRRRYGDNLDRIEWYQQNWQKYVWTIDIPRSCIRAPTFEELIFRAPLVLAFSALTSYAWFGIFASSVLFSLVHWVGKKVHIGDVLRAYEAGDFDESKLAFEIKRLAQKHKRRILLRRMRRVVTSFLFGMLTGYCVIKYQSIWLTVGMHALMNFVYVVIGDVFIPLVTPTRRVLVSLWDRIVPSRHS